MSGRRNGSRWRLPAWPALLFFALFTSASATPLLNQDGRSDKVDDGGDNALFLGHNGFIMDYDGGDRPGGAPAKVPTTTTTTTTTTPSAGDQPLPHSLASHTFLKEEATQGNTEEPDLKMDVNHNGLGRIASLKGHLKITNRSAGHHPLVPRSPTAYETSIRPANCSVGSSCSGRDHRPQQGNRSPCLCDDQCHLYGDCCSDSAASTPTTGGAALSPTHFSCRTIIPPAHRADHGILRMVYMVDRCPNGTADQLASMCDRSASLSKSDITYTMDIPFFSNRTGFVYSNVYCAKCHHDTPIQSLNISIRCSGNLSSPSLLSDMVYHPGELRWSKEKGSRDSCLLNVNYPEHVGRPCEHLIDTCSTNWPAKEDQHRCSSYNYYVEVGATVYKNWDCAVCNNASEEDIKCLSTSHLLRGEAYLPPPSLMELFTVRDDCSDDQVWDVLRRRCVEVSCGSLFTLQKGECVRNNKTVEREGVSYLNVSCYTRDFNQEYSVLFPNQSVYLNHTEQTYNFGEYEFDDSRIRVCNPKGSWTPVMNVISAVLISISLLFMLLHIAIFFALPRRRNIPSLNLVSMTCSLFVTEFMYMTFFRMNQNYTACVIFSVIIYYCLSASFMWMNVMSIDICRTFLSSTYKMKSRSVFIQYSIYAWSVPLVASLVAIIVDQVSSPDFILTPQFGTNVCWFNNKWGLVAFFTFPSGIVVLFNMVLYGMSVFNIYKQLKSGEFASSTVQRKYSSTKNKQKNGKDRGKVMKSCGIRGKENSSASRIGEKSESPRCKERLRERIQRGIDARKKQRVRLILYCKLALMMGMTWVFAFISIHTKNLVFEYLFIIFNGLQGTFIFIAFDFKRKVWDELSQKLAGRTIFGRVSARSSFTTKSSEMKSPEGNYRYRRTSKMLQDGSRRYSAVSQDITRSSQEREEIGV